MATPPTTEEVLLLLRERIACLERGSAWMTDVTTHPFLSDKDTTSDNNKNNDNNSDKHNNSDDGGHDTNKNQTSTAAMITTTNIIPYPDEVQRVRRHIYQTNCCYSAQFIHCPTNYYQLDLNQRKVILGAHSTSQLCKACLFENKNFVPSKSSSSTNSSNSSSTCNIINNNGDDDDIVVDRTNSKYYLIIVQYIESINMKKLSYELRGLRPPGPTRFDTSYFADVRLASNTIAQTLTGYGHNGVSPFGIPTTTTTSSNIPIILSKSIITNAQPRYIYVGGGHSDWKLGLAVSEFVQALNVLVLDISDPR
jgi:prolyl-tRNA editing enzyme YbaK/EbsC (Cys-tRNA(Pro) deacylase)